MNSETLAYLEKNICSISDELVFEALRAVDEAAWRFWNAEYCTLLVDEPSEDVVLVQQEAMLLDCFFLSDKFLKSQAEVQKS